jgi:hypothetical protein
VAAPADGDVAMMTVEEPLEVFGSWLFWAPRRTVSRLARSSAAAREVAFAGAARGSYPPDSQRIGSPGETSAPSSASTLASISRRTAP